MKIVYETTKIIALASDDLETSQQTIPAPEWFTAEQLGNYIVLDGQVVLKPVEQITPRQARTVLALIPAFDPVFQTLLAEINAYFETLPEPQKTIANVSWEYSTSVSRSNPLIMQMQVAFPRLTTEVIDELFACANSIPEDGVLPNLPIPMIPELQQPESTPDGHADPDQGV